MKHLIFWVLLIGATLPLVNCSNDLDCDPGPYYGDLKVKVTIDEDNPELFLVIYDGYYEKGDTLISEWVSEPEMVYEMEAGNYYSATVVYSHDGRQILALDGKEMSIDDGDEDDCPSANSLTLKLELLD